MSRLRNVLSVLAAFATLFAISALQANAQRSSDRQIRDVVRNLSSKVDDFRYNLDYQLRSSSASRQDSGNVLSDLVALDRKISDFQLNLDQHRENRDDVDSIIDAAKRIDDFLFSNPQNQGLTSDWNQVKDLIDRLAANYSVKPQWEMGTSSVNRDNGRVSSTDTTTSGGYKATVTYPSGRPNAPRFGIGSNLIGTYQIDRTRSENADQIINEANVDQANRQDLEQKLEAPEQLAIDIRGNEITLASSKAPPVTFLADGRDKVERDSSGRSVRTRATLRAQELTVSSLGGDNDYTVTFTSQDGGRTLKVTRRITTEYLNQTIFADSVYTRTDTVAQLGINGNQASNQADTDVDNGNYSDNDANTSINTRYGRVPSAVPGRTGEYIVPNGITLTGLLDSTIDTKVSQNNDRFKMTVQTPNEFRGAVIEGYLSGVGRSGRVSGSSNVTFNFEKITLRTGETYDFAGFLQSIKDQNGKVVKVDAEGVAKGDSQTRETAKRGGIGAGIGALIGVIAGGGKGAAIGAIIGGGAGAGSVVAQGRDDVRLMPGSLITVQSSSPIRQGQPN
jgi:hypothetical protein